MADETTSIHTTGFHKLAPGAIVGLVILAVAFPIVASLIASFHCIRRIDDGKSIKPVQKTADWKPDYEVSQLKDLSGFLIVDTRNNSRLNLKYPAIASTETIQTLVSPDTDYRPLLPTNTKVGSHNPDTSRPRTSESIHPALRPTSPPTAPLPEHDLPPASISAPTTKTAKTPADPKTPHQELAGSPTTIELSSDEKRRAIHELPGDDIRMASLPHCTPQKEGIVRSESKLARRNEVRRVRPLEAERVEEGAEAGRDSSQGLKFYDPFYRDTERR